MWVIGLELFIALPLVLIVLWAMRAGKKSQAEPVITSDEAHPRPPQPPAPKD